MVNEDILGGLKTAMRKGESLKRAMFSMYNAGYKKEEIEEAARVVQREQIQQVRQAEPVKEIKQIAISKPLAKPVEPIVQRVSHYGINTKPKMEFGRDIAIIMILVFMLLILIGGLTTLIIFKENIIDWLNLNL